MTRLRRDTLEVMCDYGDRMQDYPVIKVRHRTAFGLSPS